MKKIVAVFAVFIFTLHFSQKKTSKFSVSHNRNIETYFLAEILSAEHRKNNKDFELYKIKECSVYQPIVKKAIEKYGSLKNSKIAVLTAQINDVLMEKYSSGNDVLMKPLLYHREFPADGWVNTYSFNDNKFTKKQNEEVTSLIRNYISELHHFYVKENIGDFFEENKDFYKSAEAEYDKQIPSGFTDVMEEFYGESFNAYTILISPMMMWPIEDNEGELGHQLI